MDEKEFSRDFFPDILPSEWLGFPLFTTAPGSVYGDNLHLKLRYFIYPLFVS